MAGECTFLPDFLHTSAEQFGETNFFPPGAASADDIFSVLEVPEGVSGELTAMERLGGRGCGLNEFVFRESTSCGTLQELVDSELALSLPKTKRLKPSLVEDDGGAHSDGQQKVSHISVERNRRKQMNEHLAVLRSLVPCFYVKRGDQASIIGGVVDYITELQQVLRTLEAKNKQRKVYSGVLSPLPLSPKKQSLRPRPSLPISPRTPQPASPYGPRLPLILPLPPAPNSCLSPSPMANTTSPSKSSSTSDIANDQLIGNSRSAIAEVEVKFTGCNLLVKTHSTRLPGQATKIIAVLEDLSLEVLQANISIADEAMVNSFTIKVGVECRLSAEDLAQHIQQTFC